MSGIALDHRLVRDYLRELDAAMRGLPPTQAHELREQITAHLDDALQPGASDHEVAATLSRLGSPAGLAAEAGAASGSPGPRLALSSRRVQWRLAAVIAVPAAVAAVLGALQISSDASSYVTSGRDQHLAQLNAAVITLTQKLEDERDLSAAYVAHVEAGPVPVTLTDARTATDAAARIVQADAAGVGAGYQPGTVQDLDGLLASIADLGAIRQVMSSPAADTTEQELFAKTVAGAAVDRAAQKEALAEQAAAANPPAPLTRTTGLDAATWYGDMSTTIGDTRKIAGQAVGQITVRANTLKSNATRSLLLTSIVTLLLLVLLISAALARPLGRLLRKLRSGPLHAVTR